MTYRVTLQRSGRQFDVDEDEDVLSAALRDGVILPYSCRNGSCASCKAEVVNGQWHYPGRQPDGLDEGDHQAGLALLCQARAGSDLTINVREIEVLRDIPRRVVPARVAIREQLAADVMRIYLKLPRAQRMQFLAGQYVDVLIGGGRRRAFSIANAPHDDGHLELHIRHVAGGDFTNYVFHEMPERALLRLEGPLGTFFIRDDEQRPLIMMGGGTGFAPLKAMIEHLHHRNDPRSIHLYWGARQRDDLYLHELPLWWQKNSENFRYSAVLSEPAAGQPWDGQTGFVHHVVLKDYPDLSDFDVYMSGPPAMIDAARHEFVAAGLPERRLYYDSFDFAPDVRLGRRAPNADQA